MKMGMVQIVPGKEKRTTTVRGALLFAPTADPVSSMLNFGASGD
jgi:hypothetical protein